MQPDLTQLIRLAQSPEGQKLLKCLQKNGPEPLLSAGALLRSGDREAALRILGPMLSDPEAKRLLEALGEKL